MAARNCSANAQAYFSADCDGSLKSVGTRIVLSLIMSASPDVSHYSTGASRASILWRAHSGSYKLLCYPAPLRELTQMPPHERRSTTSQKEANMCEADVLEFGSSTQRTITIALFLFLGASSASGQDQLRRNSGQAYLAPEETARQFRVPDGFEVK